jgi:hypothetical protein
LSTRCGIFGPAHVRGLTADDVAEASLVQKIIGDLLEVLSGSGHGGPDAVTVAPRFPKTLNAPRRKIAKSSPYPGRRT